MKRQRQLTAKIKYSWLKRKKYLFYNFKRVQKIMRPTDKKLTKLPQVRSINFWPFSSAGRDSYIVFIISQVSLMVFDKFDGKYIYSLFLGLYLEPSFIIEVIVFRITTITTLDSHWSISFCDGTPTTAIRIVESVFKDIVDDLITHHLGHCLHIHSRW